MALVVMLIMQREPKSIGQVVFVPPVLRGWLVYVDSLLVWHVDTEKECFTVTQSPQMKIASMLQYTVTLPHQHLVATEEDSFTVTLHSYTTTPQRNVASLIYNTVLHYHYNNM